MTNDAPKVSAAQARAANAESDRPRGRLFIVSAPSGAGKSTLCQLVRQRLPALRYSTSYTTRAPRAGEIDGEDYFFVDVPTFEAGITDDRWAEWARVHGHYYGTAAARIAQTLAEGHDLLLDIDVQGAAQLVARYPEAVTIFIMPPSLDVLRQRLEQRGSDAPEVIDLRLRNAPDEITARSRYRHVVVNTALDQAVEELIAIMAPPDLAVATDE